VYTADLNHSTSTVIENGRVVDTQAVGFFPWRVAVDPVTKTVWVTDNAEGRVSFFRAR
jgi:DNA-binding beta-propeller fold protein YncE